jgi:hypothetical protein
LAFRTTHQTFEDGGKSTGLLASVAFPGAGLAT